MPVLVSIIIRTTGDRPDLFRQAVLSALAQTWRPLEVIVAEDGGNSTAAALARCQADAVATRHLALPKGGRSAAGNAGLFAASGDLLGFLDDDDWLEPNHVETLAKALELHPDTVAAYSQARKISVTAAGRTTRRQVMDLIPLPAGRLWLGNTLPIQSVLFRRSLFESFGGFDASLDELEDWDLWLRYFSSRRVIGVPEVTSNFRVPSERKRIIQRANRHHAALPMVLKKNKGLCQTFGIEDLRQLDDVIMRHLDERVGVRWCLGRIWRRLVRGY